MIETADIKTVQIADIVPITNPLLKRYKAVRNRTESICKPLEKEDYVVQPVADVSPPKWHIGHTTWFFETFILKQHVKGYEVFNADYNFVFNSYYETVGARVIRTNRGNLSRPTVDDVYAYRAFVDEAMEAFLDVNYDEALNELIMLGLNHEEQHQELLYTDIKFILGNNPLFPAYSDITAPSRDNAVQANMLTIPEGVYEIGYKGNNFCFDNELAVHKVYLNGFEILDQLVTNSEYLQFINDGGYINFRYWHAEGWDWVNQNKVQAPMYWHLISNQWYCYTFNGLQPMAENDVLNHVSFYEAAAYATWKGMRLPTEFEWEIAASQFDWGLRWEWTESAYLPYPGFTKAPGAIGEYNGKFMVNQKVLRGGSQITSPGHSRPTYRNFFHPYLRWQYTGIRLAK